MIAKMGLKGDPPIGCDPTDRALTGGIHPEGELCVRRQGTVSSELEIEHIVEEGVGAETGNLLRVNLLDKGAGGRHRRQRITYVRKVPRRNCVPDILNGRAVVGGYTPEQSVPVDVDQFREAYVRIVPAEAVANPIIRSLNKRADIVGDPPPGKEAHLLHDEIVIHPKPGS